MEIRVEGGERVDGLVRLTNVVKEEGDWRPLCREVSSTIGKRHAEPVAEHFLENV